MRTVKRKLTGCSVVLCGALAAVAWLFWMMVDVGFDESLYTTKNSMRYFFTLPPAVIRSFPEIAVHGDVGFHYSVGDGPKPTSYGIWYSSMENLYDLTEALSDFIGRHGFSIERHEKNPCVSFRGNKVSDGSIELNVCEDGRTRLRSVGVIYYKDKE